MAIAQDRKIPELRLAPPRAGVAPAAPVGDVLIARMKQKADLSQEARLPRGAQRRKAVYDDLVATASSSQVAALARLGELQKQGAVSAVESMFLPNAIVVKAAPGKHQAVADALRGVADIQSVVENRTWSLPSAPASDAAAGAAAPRVEWGAERVGAPAAWARGIDGAGVTVGIVDTGLDASHPALAAQYRGTQPDGSQVHDYNWFDPIGRRSEPYDDGQHGTHVAGSVAGATPDRVLGVAPGARIIAAKAILGSGLNTTEATLKALQFMLAPTDTQGRNPDPVRGADVVNNSWGNADRGDTTFLDTWEGLLAAGIEPVSAVGNDGPAGKVGPPGSYPTGIGVAATTASDRVAGFSSRGPSKFDPKAVIPMLAAPGAGVTSAIPGGRYATFSGTSMASPHVAGAVALLLQAKPTATHEEIVRALSSTAVDIDAPGPDSAAGHGRIDVDKAITALLQPPPVRAAG